MKKIIALSAVMSLALSISFAGASPTVEIAWTGEDSDAFGFASLVNKTKISNTQEAAVVNDVYSYAGTGDNDTKIKNGGNGDLEATLKRNSVTTGDAESGAKADNKVNGITMTLESDCECSSPEVYIHHTGEDSTANGVAEEENKLKLKNEQAALVANGVGSDAKTGDNDTKIKNGGNGDVEVKIKDGSVWTGNASSWAEAYNIVNVVSFSM